MSGAALTTLYAKLPSELKQCASARGRQQSQGLSVPGQLNRNYTLKFAYRAVEMSIPETKCLTSWPCSRAI